MLIGRGVLGDVLADAQRLHPRRRIFLLTDANVRAAGHVAALTGDRAVAQYVIDPPGEVSKHIGTVTDILDAMESLKFGRDSLLVALGGGTVGDIGGFAAAIFKRGIPYVQVPTTTVAQADSSVGGKAGVDSRLSKNAYGVFKQPARVYMDVATLATLDDRAYRAGLVESVKHAMIADAGIFRVPGDAPGRAAGPRSGGAGVGGRAQCHDQGTRRGAGRRGAGRSAHSQLRPHGRPRGGVGQRLPAAARRSGGAGHPGRRAHRGGTGPRGRKRRAAARRRCSRNSACPRSFRRRSTPARSLEIMSRDKKALEARPRFVLLDRLGHAREENGEYVRAVDPAVLAKALANWKDERMLRGVRDAGRP